MSGQTLPIWEFEDVGDNWTKANSDKIAPIIAVPTTAGTGSETGRASVILNEDTFLITARTIKPKITKKTKAVIVVSLQGLPVDIDPILKLTKKNLQNKLTSLSVKF